MTSLANLTQDVSPLAIHFGTTRTQTWLLVRMPEPAPAGQPQKLPESAESAAAAQDGEGEVDAAKVQYSRPASLVRIATSQTYGSRH